MKKTIITGCEGRGDSNSPYLTRYTLIERKNWQLCLHIFHRSDHVDLHDHPWDFVTWVLWRGYIDETPKSRRRIWPGMILYRPAKHIHRVELIDEKPAVTLVWMGKRKRVWGFYEKGIWSAFFDYFKKKRC
ncbi:hypothetical protein BWI97_15810 [Siphonobacter sp. BAB-5405]|uniref:hypothetical protein n=1 Tax=Siphonobacter sp. BAB-5405 TaxID=1864825 RepID=UPI000C809361|nr:hypothetical protein [Siphonobacter sp. BAB-5405]PMD94861.1 hypothetical protein BWI97_15810 [Siphonobacter sp. BAB-5405]